MPSMETQPRGSSQHPGLPGRFRLAVLFLVLLVNVSGGFLLFLFYSVIDVSSFQRLRFIGSGETMALAMIPAALALFLCWIYTRPVFEYLRAVTRPGLEPLEEGSGGGRIIHLRRRALRFPLMCALFSLAGWIVAGIVTGIMFWSTRSGVAQAPLPGAGPGLGADALSEGLYISGSLFRRQWSLLVQSLKSMGISTLFGGMISAVMFFVVESVWQRELPKFFPGGRLTAVSDPLIIPVRSRLIAMFVLVGTVPLILIGILSYQRALAMVSQPPEDVLAGMLLLNIFLVLVGLALAALLAGYVARSVSEPVERMRTATEKVKEGDLTIRLPIMANDELGRVSEGFNDMVRALSEKEASIRELTLGLEEKVKHRTRELEQALHDKEMTQAQLVQSEKMASLGQLVAGVAHEINNPVGYIYANTDHLERYREKLAGAFESRDPKGFEAASKKMAGLISSTREGARRAKDIVAGLRSFSRKDPSLRKPMDVHESLETALMLLGHELKAGIELEKDYGELPPVVGNPGELSQVFTNIIMNAVQAMEGKGRLRISTREREGRVSVVVCDSGPGIDPADLEHVFEPFFTTKDVGQGTGLGLSIAYGIVRAHGGGIEVKSEKGEGTTVEVLLPAGGE